LGKTTIVDTSGCDYTLDSAYWQQLLEPMLRETDIFLPSYDEAAQLTGQKELSGIRDALAPYGLQILAIKLGKMGCYVTDFKGEWKIPAFDEFKPIDTTGAGDSFVGGFITGLAAGWPPNAAAIFANVVAGFNVTKVGATGGIPDFNTAYSYVTEHAGMDIFPR
jgi:ribokinase